MNRPYARTPALLFGSLLLLVASTAWSAAYRWTDADGNVQYGDLPPTGVQAERLRPPPPPPLPEPAPEETAAAAAPVEEGAEPGGQPVEVTAIEGKPEGTPANEEALKVEQERARVEQENARIEAKNAEIKKANCAAARSNLERLKLNRPTRVYDEKSPSYRGRRLSAEERDQAMREAQKQIRENCN